MATDNTTKNDTKVERPVYDTLESKLDAFTQEDSSTSKTVSSRMDEDMDSIIFEFDKKALIAAIGPSQTGLSKGCMLQMGGTFQFTAPNGVTYDVTVSLGRGGAGAWATTKFARGVLKVAGAAK